MDTKYIEEAKEILANKCCLCFEGGGVLGVGHVGALSRMNELGGLKNITHVVGTSVGSFIAGALGCGADFEYIHKIFFGLKLKKFQDSPNCALIQLIRLFKNLGPNKGTEVKKIAALIMEDLTGNPDITFLEAFNKFGIRTTITYLSFNYEKTRYADYKTQPNLMIREAILRSSSIPFFYEPVKVKRDGKSIELIIDGGVTDNYPIHVLRDQHCCDRDIIGFKLCSRKEFNEYREDQGEEVDEIDKGPEKKLIDYGTRVVSIMHTQALRYHVKDDDWKLTVKTDIGNLKTTDFDITEEQKDWLYEEGRKGVDKHIEEIVKMLANGGYFEDHDHEHEN